VIGVTVLGSTGSIGVSTLDVVGRHRDKYRVVALSANKQLERLFEQCVEFEPDYAVIGTQELALVLEKRLRESGIRNTQVLAGVEGLEAVASLPETDYVMAAIVGGAGLRPTLAAARSGKRILLANKEALVMSGDLFMQEVRDNKALLLPIDSEHNAIFQSMPPEQGRALVEIGVDKILLTASGGPFRETPVDALHSVTPEQAVAHPNWSMGKKISVDSATMMNKGLEVIEAHWLFGASAAQIQVVIHPQSVIHSLVQYVDGSVLAQLGNPDMRTPIAHALAWPERIASGVEHLDLFSVARLDFQEADMERFPCLKLAYQALNRGDSASAILNAANEVAVAGFLNHEIGFMEISNIIEETLNRLPIVAVPTIEAVFEVDQKARNIALELTREARVLH